MGCAFNLFVTSWKDGSYVITLIVICWVIPLLIIFISYNGIIYRVKHSRIRNSGERRKSSGDVLKNDEQVIVHNTRLGSFVSLSASSRSHSLSVKKKVK